jgi:hypothetical protein
MNKTKLRLIRSLVAAFVGIALITGAVVIDTGPKDTLGDNIQTQQASGQASKALETLDIKGRAPKTGYERSQFGNGWAAWRTCNTRDRILARDMADVTYQLDTCKVASGTLQDPYTGNTMFFVRGPESSQEIHIDHVVALSDAWQKGAQQLTPERREQLANDDLNLLAVEGKANQQKGDGDAATWLPPNKPFRCQYVARQVAVKAKYTLWVTQAEHDTMARVLGSCPGQRLPGAQ